MDIRDLVPEHILEITPYQPGKPIEELQRDLGVSDCIKLASNENPLGPSPKALAAMQDAIQRANIYPDGGSYYIKNALAEKFGVLPSQIFTGNGSDEVIELMMKTFLTPSDSVVLSHYSFIVYTLAALGIGAAIHSVPRKVDYTHDLEAMADAVTADTKMIFIDNPTNPLGTMVGQEAFDAFMQRVPERVLVVSDEAYDEYVDADDFPDSFHYLRKKRRILILKTFSKIYGLAGLRIGYGIGPEEVVDAANRIRPPFNVNSIAQAAALAALGDREHVERSREVNRAGKDYLYRSFEEMGLTYIPSYGNFVTVDFERDAAAINDSLLRQGVIVRPIAGYGLPHHLRISVGTQAHNERLIRALGNALQESA
ncbi:histidinol-phosphate transaminase [candidate division KSB3 bacterium]|uniref:Histidinol-phosphate aminotransferase n=1 Tax=candidate division KSB3 bacterium TaxID=2044937 RepID=A0A2G6E332_9BACT|nr:MAG: histidinol-phosphate transaminase [candidate division KSB3 bacterium]PIE28944.1 MAG: histidinol-phosphate transaminase [candidate division KSB3 bacterium]